MPCSNNAPNSTAMVAPPRLADLAEHDVVTYSPSEA